MGGKANKNERDDKIVAEEYRKHQARVLINSIVQTK